MEVQAFAKVNLTLEVLGKRADGYHDLRSVVARIGIADRITITDAPGTGVALEVKDTGAQNLNAMCAAEHNLAYRAAALLGGGVKLCIYKQIHLGAGLGGGSADAAAVLAALGARRGKSVAELIELAAQLGSDVPALVAGGCVLMEGRGERVSALPPPAAVLPVVVALPRDTFCPTPKVYATYAAAAAKKSLHKTAEILYNMRIALSGTAVDVAKACMNDLGEAAACVAPAVGELVARMRAAGAINPVVSGSGAAVYAVCADHAQAQALAAEVAGVATEIVR